MLDNRFTPPTSTTGLHQLFESQVNHNPTQTALVFESQRLSYLELNQRANQLARLLQSNYRQHTGGDITSDTVIGLYLDRSVEMIVAILAILKTGAAYLPISPKFPQARCQFIVTDSGADLVLTQHHYGEQLSGWLIENQTTPMLLAVEALINNPNEVDDSNLDVAVQSNDLAYVIYTSGTSGQPKGVMIEHQGIVNTALAANDSYPLASCQRTMLFTDYVFDVSVLELFMSLSHGLTAYLTSEAERLDVRQMEQLIEREQIELITMTPIVLSLFNIEQLSSLKVTVVGGEACPQALLERLVKHCLVFNAYGPTEISVCSSNHAFTSGDSAKNIGAASTNYRLYVVNDNGQCVGAGETGQLCISGVGLARGYLNQPELSASRFVANPFATEQDKALGFERLYYTGDLVKRLSDDEHFEVEFVGRNDDQVKVRGFRIELGEIEQVLGQIVTVNQAVVVTKNHGGQDALVAYLTLTANAQNEDSAVVLASIKAEAESRLTEYMVPASFNLLEQLPLTVNGKVDKRALPEPIWADAANFVAPRNDMEVNICQVVANLLNIEQVGIEDNFFNLGVNSLLATSLSLALAERLGLRVEVVDIFAYNTVALLAEYLQDADGSEVDKAIPFLSGERPRLIPLSQQNQQIWFLTELNRHIRAYNCQFKLCLQGPLDIERLEQTLTLFLERHEIYRTTFKEIDGQPSQVVEPAWYVKLDPMDVSHLAEDEQVQTIAEFVRKQADSRFDVSQLPLVVWTLIKRSDERYELVQFEHHFVHDGMSFNILLQDYRDIYNALCAGVAYDEVLAQLPTAYQYADYALYQQRMLQAPNFDSRLARWAERLSAYPSTTMLIGDYARPKKQTFEGERLDLRLDDDLIQGLEQFAQQNGVTLYATMLTAFSLLVNCYSQQDKLLIASAASNRKSEEEQTIIGMLVNTTVLPIDIDGDASVAEFVKANHLSVVEALKAQDIPFPLLVDKVNPERRTDINPLCQLSFSFHDSANPALDFTDLNAHVEIMKNRSAKFDMNVVAIPPLRSGHALTDDNRLQLLWEYNHALFSESTMARIIDQYIALLHMILRASEQKVSQVSLLTDEQRQQLLFDHNQLKRGQQADTQATNTLLQLFDQQKVSCSEQVAVIYGEQQLSYRQLDERANQLAHAICDSYQQQYQQPMAKDTPVVLYLDRGVESLVAVLAVFKAGGAYVPVSVEYPDVRTEFILQDTRCPVVISSTSEQDNIRQRLACREDGDKVCLLLADDVASYSQYPTSNLSLVVEPQDLAYIIYTSGTTGQPKGVMVTHGGYCHFVEQYGAKLPLEQKNVLSLTQYTFDIFCMDYGMALSSGGCMVISEATKAQQNLTKHFDKINCMQQTPSMWQLFVNDGDFEQYKNGERSLKHIVVMTGGESGTHELFELLANHFKCLIQAYGPSECSIGSTWCEYIAGSSMGSERLIGHPFADEQVYVLSKAGQLQPIGAQGELYIGGVGLARGYLNRDDLTAANFVDSPLPEVQGQLYKTGDLVRWLQPDSNQRAILEYMGRNDLQVKIRGFRIELGEIESAINDIAGVQQAAVVDVKGQDGAKFLAAYYVPEQVDGAPVELTKSDFEQRLTDSLPEYMIPVSFNAIDAIPVSVNGKLERRALPEPNLVDSHAYVAPTNDRQAQLCQIWQEVLGLEQVGINDNFFSIGGNSISAVKLVTAINRQLNSEYTLANLFEQRTIAGLDAVVIDNQASSNRQIAPFKRETYPLSFAQERLLFIEQFEQGTDSYHVPYLVKLHLDTDWQALEQALHLVINAHPILKTVYRHSEQLGDYQQVIDDDVVIHHHQVTDVSALETLIREQVATVFDLAKEPSLRLHCYQHCDDQYLLIMWHHIAFDGWSTQMFLQQLGDSYQRLTQGLTVKLPSSDISYGDYALWQRQSLTGERLAKLQDFWHKQLKGFETLALPIDKPRPAKPDFVGADFDFSLDLALSNQVRELAKSQGTTLYSVLLSAFNVTLMALTGQDDIVVGTPSDNRELPQIQGLMGLFVNSLAIRNQIDRKLSIRRFIAQIHENVLQAKLHQEMPFEKLVDELEVERDSSRHPVYQVMFNLLNYNREDDAKRADLPFSPVELASGNKLYHPAKFDLSVFFKATDGEIEGGINYAVSLFEPATIANMAKVYQQVLQAFVADVNQPLANIELVSADDKSLLLNAAGGVKALDANILELFAQMVAERADEVVVKAGGLQLTYAQLDQKTNQLAAYIQAQYRANFNQALPIGSYVALYQHRSIDMLLSMLAILKVGGAYVPVSTDYPLSRQQFMLQDCGARLVITTKTDKAACIEMLADNSNVTLLCCDDDVVNQATVDGSEIEMVDWYNHLPEDLAAGLMYTSGTTGKPKGVMVNHLGITSLAKQNQVAGVNADDVVLHIANPNFDAATYEIFSALLNGAKLVIADAKQNLEPDSVAQLITDEAISVSVLTKTLFDHCFAANAAMFAQMRLLIVGGEALNPQYMQQLIASDRRPKHVINGYGPTEATTFAAMYDIEAVASSVPIGGSVAGRQLWVLDDQGRLAPIGAQGELYIGGLGVANGYFNRKDLTAKRFVAADFVADSKLYKTGDLVRWRLNDSGEPDVLEFLGRIDRQVKIRGFRIELGEIEQALSALEQVKQAAVITTVHNEQTQLVAYVVAENDKLNIDEVNSDLAKQLPQFMLPNVLVNVEHIAMTANGKLDVAALPAPVWEEQALYVAPQTEQQQQMCQIWQQALGIERVGITDSFFNLGGNSIVAVKLAAAIRQKMGLVLPLSVLFSERTIDGVLTQLVEAPSDGNDTVIETHEAQEEQVNMMRI